MLMVPPISSVDTCNSPATLTSPTANVTKAVSSMTDGILQLQREVSIEPDVVR